MTPTTTPTKPVLQGTFTPGEFLLRYGTPSVTVYSLLKSSLVWDWDDWEAFNLVCEMMEMPQLPHLVWKETRDPGTYTTMIASHLTRD